MPGAVAGAGVDRALSNAAGGWRQSDRPKASARASGTFRLKGRRTATHNPSERRILAYGAAPSDTPKAPHLARRRRPARPPRRLSRRPPRTIAGLAATAKALKWRRDGRPAFGARSRFPPGSSTPPSQYTRGRPSKRRIAGRRSGRSTWRALPRGRRADAMIDAGWRGPWRRDAPAAVRRLPKRSSSLRRHLSALLARSTGPAFSLASTGRQDWDAEVAKRDSLGIPSSETSSRRRHFGHKKGVGVGEHVRRWAPRRRRRSRCVDSESFAAGAFAYLGCGREPLEQRSSAWRRVAGPPQNRRKGTMNGIIWMVGAVVIVLFVAGVLGFR